MLAPPPPAQQLVYRYVRAGAMLGIGGSGGWMPPTYVGIRVPVITTGPAIPAQSGRSLPSSSASLHAASEQPRIRDQSNTNVQNNNNSV